MMPFRHSLGLVISLFCFPTYATERPNTWAKPIITSHLENFYQVSPMVYRSAQPYTQGFAALTSYGIGEVLDLRIYHRDVPAKPWFTLYQTPLVASNLTPQRVVQALNIIAQAKQPILVHCQHGSDRTGLVIALYRMVCQHWSKAQALDELVNGGYGYHPIFTNIPEFIQQTDVQTLRQQVKGSNCPANPE